MPTKFIIKRTTCYDCSKETNIPFVGDTRRCRFCKKSEPEGVSFKHKAHVISESLGNHNFLYEEECDECNQKLSNIEQHLANFIAPILLAYSVKGKPKRGKNDVRVIETEPLRISNRKNLFIAHLKDKFSDQVFNDKDICNGLASFGCEDNMKWHKYIPANIYRSLCKYVISTSSSEDLSLFDKTIDWINGENFDLSNYISLFSTTNDFIRNPIIRTYILASNSEEVILVFSFFQIANVLLAYEVPLFCSHSNLTKENKLKIFNDFIEFINLKVVFSDLNLQSEEKTSNDFNFSLALNNQLECGRDYFIIESKEFIDQFFADDSGLWESISKGSEAISEFTKSFLDKSENNG